MKKYFNPDIQPDGKIIRFSISALILSSLVILYLVNPGKITFFDCKFRGLTGLDCPTCGITRSIHAVLHFNLSESFFFHPMGVFIPVAFILILGINMYEILRNQRVKFWNMRYIKKIFFFFVFGFSLTWIIKIISYL